MNSFRDTSGLEDSCAALNIAKHIGLMAFLMLEQISVSNFKALHSLHQKNLKRLNVFIGQNNSGKSSILQSIAFLAQSLNHEITFTGRLVDLGTYEDTVFGHRATRKIRIGLSFRITDADLLVLPTKRESILLKGDVFFDVEIDHTGIVRQELMCKTPYIHCILEKVERQPLTNIEHRLMLNGTSVDLAAGQIGKLLGWSVLRVQSEPIAHRKAALLDDRIEKANALLTIVSEKFKSTYYFSVMRGIKHWSQGLTETYSFGAQGENAISMLHQIYSNDPSAFRRIAKWIEKMGLGTIYSTTKGPNSSIVFSDPLLKIRSNVVSTGFGINQLVSVIGECISSPTGSVIMIEEPEISLHPGALGQLIDMFLETISEEKQIMLSTHSDRVILELWARVKMGLVSEDDVALYLVEKTDNGTQVREIKLNQRRGEIKKEINILYQPRSPLDDLLEVAEKSGDKDLSKKDLSQL